MSPSDDRSLDPASIASASFTTARRGYDPNEVRAYLQRVSAELAAARELEGAARQELESLQASPGRATELDEATVAAWLGEEAARVLTTARDAANQVRGKAEEQAEQVRHDAHTEAAQVRAEAQSEAAQLREEVDAEVTRRRQESIAEAEAEIEAARQEGRSMVSEARAVRERMLADLSRRRDGARAQLAALRGERDRIVNAIEATRDHLDRLMDDLRAASPDDDRDLPSVSYDDLRSQGEPRLTLVRPLHPVHQERDQAGGEATVDTGPVDVAALMEGPSGPAAVTGEVEVVDDAAGPPMGEGDEGTAAAGTASVLLLGEVEGGPSEDEAVDEEPATETPVTDAEALPVQDEPAEVEDAPEPAGEPLDESAALSDGPIIDLDEPLPPVDAGPHELRAAVEGLLAEPPPGSEVKPSVDDLFARIRAARSEGVEGITASPVDELSSDEQSEQSEPSEASEPLDPDGALVVARSTELGPLQATLARQLKRALADEQNEVFDRLRKAPKLTTADDVLGVEADHAERYRAAGEDAVWSAALAGARSVAPEAASAEGGLEAALERHRVLDEVLDEVSLEFAMPVRERLEAALAAADGDPEEATTHLRNAYRDWKAQRIDELAGELVLSAYGRGAYAAIPPGAPVRWVIDVHAPACPDGDVNAAAGIVACGDAFPTGHRHPPANAGCRCLLGMTHG